MNGWLRKIFVAVSVMAMFSTSNVMAAANSEPTTLTVEGEGTASAMPNQASVVIGVVSQASDATKAQQDNATKSAQINQAIKALGIAAKDIQTNNYYFQPIYSSDDNRRHEISGYTVNNSIVVTVRDITKTGKVIDAALACGANEISSLNFTTNDTKTVRKAALAAAISDARDKAEIIASGLGYHIIGVQNVSENIGRLGSRQFNGAILMASKAVSDTTIEPGSLSLNAQVNIVFVLGK